MKSDKAPEWESPRQCAEALGVSRATIYNLIGRGRLDARKLAGRTIISVASRRKLVEGLPKANISRPKYDRDNDSQPAT